MRDTRIDDLKESLNIKMETLKAGSTSFDNNLQFEDNFTLRPPSELEILENLNFEEKVEETEEKLFFQDFVNSKLGLKEHQQIYCLPFQAGRCHSKNCPQIHILLSKAVVCKHWLRGLCKKSSQNKHCEYLHEYNLAKMPECWFFSKYGECSNNECLFVHLDPDSKSKECLYYNKGFCKHGNECRGVHKRRRVCTSYMLGFCKDGPLCKNGHPKGEVEREGRCKRRIEDVINLKNKKNL